MWDELKKTALLGTSKHQLPEQELAYLEKLGLDMNRDPAHVLLDGLAMWSNIKKAGMELKKWDTLMEAPEMSSLSNPNLKLADAISALFKYNGFEVLVPQTISLLHKKGIAFPSELYPQLIAYFEKHINQYLLTQEQMEDRFYWLVRQNPAWHAFANDLTIEKVESIKDQDLRSIAMYRYTAQKGEEAIGHFYNEWESLSKPLQTKFLKIFAPQASALVDSLFEKIYDEKDKDTYRYTLQYFSSTKNKKFLDSITPILEKLIKYSSKKVLIDDDIIQKIRVLFLKKHLPIFKLDKSYGFEIKNLLFNFFSVVPITFLCETLECTWPDFLSGLEDGDELHELALLGLCYSAGQNPLDQELFLQTIVSGQFPILEQIDLLPVYNNMSSYQLGKLYETLTVNKFTFKDNAMEMLMLHPEFIWPNDLVKVVMKVLPVRLLNAEDSKQDPNFIMFKNMILNCDPNMYAYINSAFQANPVYSWNSTKIIEKQLKILKMRWQILREL